MLKALLTAIGGVTGVGFFGTWGISQTVNVIKSNKPDKLAWLKEGYHAIIGDSKRNKGIAVKIPDKNFKLNCDEVADSIGQTNYPNKEECKKVEEKLNQIKKEVEGEAGGLANTIKSGQDEGKDDPNCGNIFWDIESKDKNTNLLSLAKFLIKVYCFESYRQNNSEKFKNKIIDRLSEGTNNYEEGELIGGIFNNEKIWGNVGNTLIGNEVEKNLKKLINNDEKLNKWLEILKDLTGRKLILRVDSNLVNNQTNKWLIIQKLVNDQPNSEDNADYES